MDRYTWLLLAALLAPTAAHALDNDYVRITRDGALCALGDIPGCADRVIVALGDIEVQSGQTYRKLSRGGVAVFGPGESYVAPAGAYLEVAVKPDHPASDSLGEIIAPEKNAMLYEGGGTSSSSRRSLRPATPVRAIATVSAW